jgi:hypothetical protein
MGTRKAKANYRRTVLRLHDMNHSRSAVLNSLTSLGSRRVFQYAIEQFTSWYCSEPLGFQSRCSGPLPHAP